VTFDLTSRDHRPLVPPIEPSQHQRVDNQLASPGPAAAGPIRVLIAESDAHVRAVVSWGLAHDSRFRVVATVGDGDAAVTCPLEFDVALVDLSIHGQGGLGTVASLRQRVPTPAVVVLSGVDAVYLRHAAAAEGAVDFAVISEGLEHLGDRLERAAGGPG
jgi:DNA-binding NarL/FixJ family response regulator